MKKLFIIIGVIAVLAGAQFTYSRYITTQKESVPIAVDVAQVMETQKTEVQKTPMNKTQPEKKTLPPSLNLNVPFYSQAPLGNWGFPWQEACEEASMLLIANTYFQHNWNANQFNDQILKMVDWQKKKFGYYESTTVNEMQTTLSEFLKLDSIVHENPTFEDIQTILNKGHLIVMPVAGKEVHNPNYKNGGPIYHVFMVKGYKENKKIITNDVGTRKGADYVYAWNVIENALHDHTTPIQNGAKKIIEVLPPQSS